MKTDANANFNMGISAEYKVLRNINMKILNVVGARPNFMKIAPIVEKMKQAPDLEPILVHTGQHYSEGMSDVFFRDLGIPVPDVYLGVGSGSHAEQTARVMVEFEKVCLNTNRTWYSWSATSIRQWRARSLRKNFSLPWHT